MKKKMFKGKSIVLVGAILFLFGVSLIGVWAVDGYVSQENTSGVEDNQNTENVNPGEVVNDFAKFDANNNGTCDYLEANISTFISRYGSDISYDSGSHNLVITLDKNRAADAVKKSANLVKFKVTEIEIIDVDNETKNVLTGAAVGQYISSTNKVLTFDEALMVKNKNTDVYSSYSIKIEPDGFNDELITQNCGVGSSFFIVLNYEHGGKSIHQKEELKKYSYPSTEATAFNCSGYQKWDPNSFDYKFCYDYTKAENSNNLYHFDPTNNKNKFSDLSSTAQKFTCNAFNVLDSNIAAMISNNKEYQYINKSYLAGEITTKKDTGLLYKINYGGQNSAGVGTHVLETPVKCNVKCKEAVSVEYGVPVATTAGLCFEYNIKVTSRVKCNASSPNPPPDVKDDYCTPVPECLHDWGEIRRAAGPDEDFDSCVVGCDGGKYTDSCVDQCYQEVYENDLLLASTTAINKNSSINGTKLALHGANTMDRDESCNGKGTYTINDEGVISWKPPQCYGRYYVFHPKSIGYHSCTKTNAEGGGISSDCGCDATCKWTDCSQDEYLNPGEAQRDIDANDETYNKAVEFCKKYSTCNTTTATFSMDVTLNSYDNNGNDVVVHLPFNNNSSNKDDSITFDDVGGNIKCTNDTISKGANTTIISTDGCYSCNKNTSNLTDEDKNTYITEWGFPGTWINNKSGEISYIKQGDTWTQYTHKFCTPLDIHETNADWWLYYYKHKYGNDSSFAYNDEEYLEKAYCRTGSDSVSVKYPSIPTKQSEIPIDYNILGKTRNFGYFEWNIDVSCFYAYARLDGGCNDEQKQRIRSVDLNNLFPDSGGTPLTSPTESGRSPGFNWGYHATNLDKDKNYTSSPSEYMRFVQSKGYSIYSDQYLDYEVILTRENIRELKDANRNYTDYLGTYNVDSVVNYKSPLFRGGNPMFSKTKGNKFPYEQALACNNMENNSSTKCQDLTK